MDENDSRTWRLPTGDAWRACTLRGIIESGDRVWLDCSGCYRHSYVDAAAWAAEHQIDIDMPLVLLGRRIRCRRCGRRTVAVKGEPYSNLPETEKKEPNGEVAVCSNCGSGRVTGSAPLRRPYDPRKAARQFMRGHIMIECECLACGNWWCQPEELWRSRQPLHGGNVLHLRSNGIEGCS